MKKESGFTWKLGMFVTIGLVLLMATVYFVGKQKNLFGSTFILNTKFKTVSGLKIGNNIRFSGINVGTIDDIQIINDSSVAVRLLVKEEVRKFIKTDAKASIGSDGLMGDKVLTISPGVNSQKIVQNNASIATIQAVEMEDIMKSVSVSVDNAAIITDQLAEFSYKLNNGDGLLSKLLTDPKMGEKMDATMTNIQKGTKGFDENMEAAKENFLFKGYYKRKKKAEEKKKEDLAKKKEKEAKKAEKQLKDKKEEEDKAKEEEAKAKAEEVKANE